MKIHFDGFELTSILKIRDVKRDILPPREVQLLQVPNRDGAYLTNVRHGVRTIEVDVIFKAKTEIEFTSLLRKLAVMLESREPASLIFSDEPDKEYFAVLSDDSTIKELLRVGEGTLKFLCPDPVAYSTSEKIYRPLKTPAWVVENKGTTSTYPQLFAQVKKDTDFIWYQSPNGAILLGEPGHVDKESLPKYETEISDKCNTLSGWVGHANFDSYITASNVFRVDTALDGLVPSAYGTVGSSVGWNGAGMRKSLSEDILDFKCEFNFWLSSEDGTSINDSTRKGRIEIYGFASDGSKVFKCSMRDSLKNHECNIPEMYIGNSLFLEDEPKLPKPKVTYQKKKDKKGKWVTTKKVTYTEHVGKWNACYGKFYVSRVNNVWEFKLDKISNGKVTRTLRKTFNDRGGNKYGSKKLSYIAVFMGRYKTEPTMKKMALTHMKISKVNLKTTIYNEDIFNAGDEITVDCSTGEVYVNDELRLDIVDTSSIFFDVDPGKTTIKQKTDGNIETEMRFRERYL